MNERWGFDKRKLMNTEVQLKMNENVGTSRSTVD